MKSLFYCLPVRFIGLATLLELVCISMFTVRTFDCAAWTYKDLNIVATQLKEGGNYFPALQLLDWAIKIKPHDPENYISRGVIYGILHQKEKGVQDELKAISLANSNSQKDIDCRSLAHQSLASVYVNNKQDSEAETELKTALQLCPDDPLAAERLAILMLKNKKPEQGLLYFIKAKESYTKKKLPEHATKISNEIADLQPQSASLSNKISSVINKSI